MQLSRVTLPPAITVLIATYNQAEFLDDALGSVLEQTLTPDTYEIVVVDDGSTDHTEEILVSYGDRVRVIRMEHSGLVAACNRGLLEARGDYMVRVDSDDTVEPQFLARLQDAFVGDRGNNVIAVYSDRHEHFPHGSVTVRLSGNNVYDLIACGVMMRTDVVRAIGGYRQFFWEEYDLFLRMLMKGRFEHVPVPLYHYRRHPANMTSNVAQRQLGWQQLCEEWGAAVLLAAGTHPEMETCVSDCGAERRI